MRSQRFLNSRAMCGSVALLALGTAAPAWAQNLLFNPGFEAPPGPPVPNPNVLGWTLVNDAERASFQERTGVFSLWAKTFQPAGGGAYQTITGIDDGTQYDFSSFLFFETNFRLIAPEFPVRARMGLTWFNSGGTEVGTPTFLNIAPADVTPQMTDTWVPFTLNDVVAPAGATQVRPFLGWSGGDPLGQNIAVFFDDAELLGIGDPPPPINSTWATNGSGDYNQSANWANGMIPNGVGALAEFFGAITSSQTVFSNIPITAGTLRFNNANTYVIAGAGALTLQTNGGNAQIIVQQGTHKINLPLTIATNTTFNVSGGATLKISDPMTINAGRTVNQTGGGSVIYESIVNVLSAAQLSMGNTTHMNALNLSSAASATLTTGGNKTLKTDNLSVNPTATLDLTDNDMIVANSSYTTIAGLVATARNFGSWDQPGITSSAARTHAQGSTTLGVLRGSEYISVAGTDFNGFTVAATDTLVKYTWYGDTDFNGFVDGDDYSRTDNGFNFTLGGWVNGDSDLDNDVDGDDYSLIDNAFNTQSGTLRTAANYLSGDDRDLDNMNTPALQKVVEHFDQFGVGYATSFLNSIPEPASIALACSALPALLRRRRRA